MSRRAKHRRKQCCGHFTELQTAHSDIRLMAGMIEKLADQKQTLERQVRALRKELRGETPDTEVTRPISLTEIREQMRKTIPPVVPVTAPNGSTMLLPVGNNRARRVRRPSWAVHD